jgi:signal transduction histidine kinase
VEPQKPRGKLGWIAGGVGLVAVLAALAVLLDLGPFSEPELSRSELIARGDEICRKAHAAFAAQAEVADSQRERQRIARRIGFAQCSRPIRD